MLPNCKGKECRKNLKLSTNGTKLCMTKGGMTVRFVVDPEDMAEQPSVNEMKQMEGKMARYERKPKSTGPSVVELEYGLTAVGLLTHFEMWLIENAAHRRGTRFMESKGYIRQKGDHSEAIYWLYNGKTKKEVRDDFKLYEQQWLATINECCLEQLFFKKDD